MTARRRIVTAALRRAAAGVCRRLGVHARDDDGATLVVFALAVPVIVLGLGLGAETGLHYSVQRKLQHSADTAAYAAAVRLRAGAAEAAMQAAAEAAVTEAGLDLDAVTLELDWPPATGGAAGETNAVEIVLRKAQRRHFSGLVADGPVQISARAVAQVTGEGAEACVLSTATRGTGIEARADVALEGCDLVSNSVDPGSISVTRGGTEARCAHTVAAAAPYTSGLSLTGCDAVQLLAPVTRDPYADVAPPEAPMFGCTSGGGNGGGGKGGAGPVIYEPDCTLPDGTGALVFDDGLKINGNRDVTFKPGIYIVRGGRFQINGNAGVSGEGVTFYLTDGAELRFNGTGDTALSAPADGPYSGLLFFEDREQATSHQISGNADAALQGAIYLSRSALSFTGSSVAENGCTQIVADTIEFKGSATLRAECDDAGTRPILASEQVRIIE